MHDQSRDLGRKIVHQNPVTDPGNKAKQQLSIHILLFTKRSSSMFYFFFSFWPYDPLALDISLLQYTVLFLQMASSDAEKFNESSR